MTKKTLRRYRVARRIAIVMAALPIFQLSQCATGIRQVAATTTNNLPSTYTQVINSLIWFPAQAIINSIFGTTGNNDGTLIDEDGTVVITG